MEAERQAREAERQAKATALAQAAQGQQVAATAWTQAVQERQANAARRAALERLQRQLAAASVLPSVAPGAHQKAGKPGNALP